jgi:hypothetical protein
MCDEFQVSAEKYRARFPVFAEFQELIEKEILPAIQRGKEFAHAAERMGGGGTFDAKKKKERGLIRQTACMKLKKVVYSMLRLAEAKDIDLSKKDEELLRGLAVGAVLSDAQDDAGGNPYPEGSIEYCRFEEELGNAMRDFGAGLGIRLMNLSPELEARQALLLEARSELLKSYATGDSLPESIDTYEEDFRALSRYFAR